MGATSRRVCQQGSGCDPGLCTFSALPRYSNATASGNFAADQAGRWILGGARASDQIHALSCSRRHRIAAAVQQLRDSGEVVGKQSTLDQERRAAESKEKETNTAIAAQAEITKKAEDEYKAAQDAAAKARDRLQKEFDDLVATTAGDFGTENAANVYYVLDTLATADVTRVDAAFAESMQFYIRGGAGSPTAGDTLGNYPRLKALDAQLTQLVSSAKASARCEDDDDTLSEKQREKILAAATAMLDARHRGKKLGYGQNCQNGCDGSNGYIDCSHAVHRIYSNSGLKYGYLNVAGIVGSGQFRMIKNGTAKAGDLVVFLSQDGNVSNHVGVVVKTDDSGQVTSMIHAATRGGRATDVNRKPDPENGDPGFLPAMVEGKPEYLRNQQSQRDNAVTWKMYRWNGK